MNPLEAASGAAGTGRVISLVLGSGGARGYAHIGAIEELTAQGFTIASIAGSSMGALVGGIHAAGKLPVYRDFVIPLQRIGMLRLLDWTMRGGGFIKGDRIIGVLSELIGDAAIEDLPIGYTAVAVDLDTQREVWFSRGSLFDAIRASIAIPTIFRPHRYQGRLLVDGGLLNPLPVSATLRDLTDFTIAVDVDAPDDLPIEPPAPAPSPASGLAARFGSLFGGLLERGAPAAPRERELGMVELFARSLETVQGTISRLKLAAQPPDLLISIPRSAAAFYAFDRAADLIEVGRQRTREALANWRPPPRRWPPHL
ncbi:patatin-like phospholipase family protein [Dokdonella koreensis]|uniref:Patatin n=1 Tax=Dokdonella koreensis DS-123 TaxID=1300342 RepID=A0A167G9U3_9GAMM|nr:patatin-like phospholipase family protein [Dokdonella koreensis]ANB16314.1 Patatin [Dokdonella koreensis DS-123]